MYISLYYFIFIYIYIFIHIYIICMTIYYIRCSHYVHIIFGLYNILIIIIIIGFLILTLHAVRPYKFDISMMAQTFSLDKSPIPLVLEKRNLFWDPAGYLSEN